jgi:CubicO group peptidase (beta-lactamase class C family)
MRLVLALAAVAAVLIAAPAFAEAPAAKPETKSTANILLWNEAQRIAGFPHMEDLYPVHVVKRGQHVHPLPKGKPLDFTIPIDDKALSLTDYMAAEHTAGVLVVKDGKIRAEAYGLGYGPTGRWTSFSVAKSFTSTLVGAAIKDGYIKSIDDPVTDYITGLKGSAYDGVTVRQLLTMSSGVKWNEDYTDMKSDVAQLALVPPDPGVDATVSYMRKLPREAAPGTKWVYKTGETDLIGVLVTSATHKTLADYLSEKVWTPYGMERDAVWMIDARGQEHGGFGISVSLHDYARMGELILADGRIKGRSILPKGWVEAATHKQEETGEPGGGYGYQWWTRDDGTVDARGIYGQMIHIDPKRNLVVVVNSAWPKATDRAFSQHRNALVRAISDAVDAEAAPTRP